VCVGKQITFFFTPSTKLSLFERPVNLYKDFLLYLLSFQTFKFLYNQMEMTLQVGTAWRHVKKWRISLKRKNGKIETWRQCCALRKSQDGSFRDVAMTTILAPISFCFEPNIICDSTMREGRSCLKHKQLPYCAQFPDDLRRALKGKCRSRKF